MSNKTWTELLRDLRKATTRQDRQRAFCDIRRKIKTSPSTPQDERKDQIGALATVKKMYDADSSLRTVWQVTCAPESGLSGARSRRARRR